MLPSNCYKLHYVFKKLIEHLRSCSTAYIVSLVQINSYENSQQVWEGKKISTQFFKITFLNYK